MPAPFSKILYGILINVVGPLIEAALLLVDVCDESAGTVWQDVSGKTYIGRSHQPERSI
jgi:short subunit dehydrogenase-like uncharacterized protein